MKTTKEKRNQFILNGSVHSIETRGVHVNVIDYSLSRLEIGEFKISSRLHVLSQLKDTLAINMDENFSELKNE